jgi:shikimate 5-dehydrogenase
VTRRAAVLGSPVAHSLSPLLHRTAYAELGLGGWTYDAYDVPAADLADFLDRTDESWAGLSLTMPLKAAVLTLLDSTSAVVREVGGANTVLFGTGGRRGENTDVPGMVAALREAGISGVGAACVLGGGVTAAAALAALRELGDRTPLVLLRDPARAAPLLETAERLGVQPQVDDLGGWAAACAGEAELVISTIPSGAADSLAGALPARVHGLLFDVVYDPWPTPLAAAWGARGGEVVGGLDLLIHQAVLQVELMTGVPVDRPSLASAMRAAGQQALRSP